MHGMMKLFFFFLDIYPGGSGTYVHMKLAVRMAATGLHYYRALQSNIITCKHVLHDSFASQAGLH